LSENEIALNILKLYHDDYTYRHTNYWSIVYKSIFGIIGLLSLPYFIHDTINNNILILFPLIAIFICVFSIILLESETIRMNVVKKKINDLLKNNISMSSIDYMEIRFIDYFKSIKKINKKNKNIEILPFWINLLINPITKKIRLLYILLIIISIIQIFLILTNNFIKINT